MLFFFFQGVDSWLGCTSRSGRAVLFWRWSKVSFGEIKVRTGRSWLLTCCLPAYWFLKTMCHFPSVLYFSWHRYEHQKFWPNLKESDFDSVGKGKGAGFNVNVPWNKVSKFEAETRKCSFIFCFHDVNNCESIYPNHLKQLVIGVCASLCLLMRSHHDISGGNEEQWLSFSLLSRPSASRLWGQPFWKKIKVWEHIIMFWRLFICDSLSQFCPDLVLVCAGFDSAIGDPEVLNINPLSNVWNNPSTFLPLQSL